MTDRPHYSSALYGHLAGYMARREFAQLPVYLDGLSHSDFRRAGMMMGGIILPQLDEDDFWEVFLILVQHHSRAWLGTLMKASVCRMKQGKLSLRHVGFERVTRWVSDNGLTVDKRKIIGYLLPVLDTPEDMARLFGCLLVESPAEYLLAHLSLPAAYLLFQEFRKLDYNKDLLTRYCRLLMKRGDTLSFNLASVTKSYFDLPAVTGTFSLCLKPYELSALESSYSDFCSVMCRM